MIGLVEQERKQRHDLGHPQQKQTLVPLLYYVTNRNRDRDRDRE